MLEEFLDLKMVFVVINFIVKLQKRSYFGLKAINTDFLDCFVFLDKAIN